MTSVVFMLGGWAAVWVSLNTGDPGYAVVAIVCFIASVVAAMHDD